MVTGDHRLNRFDLNLLVALDVLLDERHVTRAAQRLSVGQSAMSATLARLRKLFDDPLLVREGHRLVATPLAESLVEPLRALLDGVDALVATRGTYDPRTTRRTFRIIATDYVALIFLQPLMVMLAQDAPLVQMQIQTIGEDFETRVQNNEADLVIAPMELIDEDSSLLSTALFPETYVALVDRDNPLVGDELTAEQLRTLPRLATSSGMMPTFAEVVLRGRHYDVRSDMRVSATVAPFMVQGTPFLTLAPRRLATYAAQYHRLKVLELPVDIPPFHETMFWAARTDRDAAHRWLRSWIVGQAKGLRPRADLETDYTRPPAHDADLVRRVGIDVPRAGADGSGS